MQNGPFITTEHQWQTSERYYKYAAGVLSDIIWSFDKFPSPLSLSPSLDAPSLLRYSQHSYMLESGVSPPEIILKFNTAVADF